MSVLPSHFDDHDRASLQHELDSVQAEIDYAIQRHERLHDFAPAGPCPPSVRGEDDDRGVVDAPPARHLLPGRAGGALLRRLRRLVAS